MERPDLDAPRDAEPIGEFAIRAVVERRHLIRIDRERDVLIAEFGAESPHLLHRRWSQA